MSSTTKTQEKMPATVLATHALNNMAAFSAVLTLGLDVDWLSVPDQSLLTDSKIKAQSTLLLTALKKAQSVKNDKMMLRIWDVAAQKHALTPMSVLHHKNTAVLCAWSESFFPLLQRFGADPSCKIASYANHPGLLVNALDDTWWNRVHALRNSMLSHWAPCIDVWEKHRAHSRWLKSTNVHELQKMRTDLLRVRDNTTSPQAWPASDVLAWMSTHVLSKIGPIRSYVSDWALDALLLPTPHMPLLSLSPQQWMDTICNPEQSSGLIMRLCRQASQHKMLPQFLNAIPISLFSGQQLNNEVAHLGTVEKSGRHLNQIEGAWLGKCREELEKRCVSPTWTDVLGLSHCDALLARSRTLPIDASNPLIHRTVAQQGWPWEKPMQSLITPSTDPSGVGRLLSACIIALPEEQMSALMPDLLRYIEEIEKPWSTVKTEKNNECFHHMAQAAWVRLQRTENEEVRPLLSQLLWRAVLSLRDKSLVKWLEKFAVIRHKIKHNPRLNMFYPFVQPEVMSPVLSRIVLPQYATPETKAFMQNMILQQTVNRSDSPSATPPRQKKM